MLSRRPGFVAARLARAAEDPADWLLVTEWTGAGPWRRALSDHEVRMQVIPWLGATAVEQGAYEVLLTAGPDGDLTERPPALAEELP